jgi:hypothetical protein
MSCVFRRLALEGLASSGGVQRISVFVAVTSEARQDGNASGQEGECEYCAFHGGGGHLGRLTVTSVDPSGEAQNFLFHLRDSDLVLFSGCEP